MTKKSSFTPKIVTANDLLEGDVVYLSSDWTWVRHMRDAMLFTDSDQTNAALNHAEKQINRVVGVYLADARSTDHGLAPVHFRENFRRKGPSNYAHGKQELSNYV